MTKQQLLDKLKPYGQEHLLAFWDELPAHRQAVLAEQISRIELEQIRALVSGTEQAEDWAALARRAEPPPAFRLADTNRRFTRDQARARGNQALADGQVAVVLVAGGQGSRLGFDHPKGMFPIGPVSGTTLFQILLEKVLAVSRRYAAPVPLGVMTSPATHDETVDYLAAHEYFGLPADDVTVFCQGTMPAVDKDSGRLLLASKDSLFLSPDGHGGMPRALAAGGALDALKERGIRQLFYLQVDNPLAPVCDPEFLGNHLLSRSELSTLAVAKRDPKERVGNVVSVDGHLRIIEYSDLPDDVARRRNADGSLLLWAGSIAIHVFDVEFLARMTAKDGTLPFHMAHKAVPYIDESGQSVEPSAPNAVKFEKFIFDLLPHAARAIVVEVEASEAFAPVKNAPGSPTDTPEAVQAQMIALYADWLRQAGATVARNTPVEIGPLFALDAGQCMERIGPDLHITRATYFPCYTP